MIKFIAGNCHDVLRSMPNESVHCVVTSPPYWGLRDYKIRRSVWNEDPTCKHKWNEKNFCRHCTAWRGAHGLEPTINLYINNAVEIFREVRRVLRKDGTLWLNLGDSYAANGQPGQSNLVLLGERYRGGGHKRDEVVKPIKSVPSGLKPKDLCGIPWRVALALQADGWWLRQDLIWAKRNPMPESVTDRCTKAHEYLFLLSKGPRYYFDAEAIKESQSESALIDYARRGESRSRAHNNSDQARHGDDGLRHNGSSWDRGGRNKRSVWEIATSPFPEAHFATFPPALVEPCILAGSSEKGCCAQCGAPWVRKSNSHIEYTQHVHNHQKYPDGQFQHQAANRHRDGHIPGRKVSETLGWSSSCQCKAPTIPCTVLDPFGGAGTAGMVAERMGRDAILIEISAEYVAMARRRIQADKKRRKKNGNKKEKINVSPPQIRSRRPVVARPEQTPRYS